MLVLSILYYLLWLVLGLSLALAVVGLRGRRQGEQQLCRACGYDLRGLLGGASSAAQCPECGASIQSMAAVVIGRRRQHWRLVWVAALMALMAVGGMFGLRHWRSATVVKPFVLINAIESGDVTTTELMISGDPALARGESESGRWPTRQVPLTQAASQGQLDIVRLLLHAGADVNAVDAAGSTALHEAVASGNAAMVSVLLDAGADPEIATPGEGKRALHVAVASAWRADVAAVIVPMLLAHGADPDGQDFSQRTALHDLAGEMTSSEAWTGQEDDLAKLVALLAAQEADLNAHGPGGDRPLHLSVRHDKPKITRQLIDAGANPDVQNDGGDTPLHEAVRRNDAAVVDMLLAAGADVSIRNASQRTAMAIAAAQVSSDMTIIKALAEHGATLTPAMRQRLGLDER